MLKFGVGLLFAMLSFGQVLISSRSGAEGGTATFRPAFPLYSPSLNAPFSRELHEVRVQSSPGTAQTSRTTRLQREWRDSEGRTRLDRFFIVPGVEPNPDSGPWPTAEILDPVARFWLVLDKANKIAHRGVWPVPRSAPVLRPNTGDTVEDLGTRVIDGVTTEGKRTTRKIAAISFGDPASPVSITEIWTSPELQLTMFMKVHDPIGDTTTDFRNFSREEPALDIFLIPADYQVVDETGPFTITWGTPPPAPPPPPVGSYRIGGGVSAPVPVHTQEPTYTEDARRKGIEGTVVLQIVVREDGQPDNFKITKSLDPGLDQKAIEAVKQWRFRPGQKDGKPVPVFASIEVNFRLGKQAPNRK